MFDPFTFEDDNERFGFEIDLFHDVETLSYYNLLVPMVFVMFLLRRKKAVLSVGRFASLSRRKILSWFRL